MQAEPNGKIITLYSFKGGVGRTMALANVAFLAAENGNRVLAMDWDLEAPGLLYYFRALLSPNDARQLRDKPGVLNILWDWRNKFSKPVNEKEFDAAYSAIEGGEAFYKCITQVLGSSSSNGGGSLDFIGAGSRLIDVPDEVSYEEALARFSWRAFFSENAGGVVLENFRAWAKAHYDVVLIDSRTGLADVAGICTMQIPDVVGLCFILNQQNVDGVSKVAASIRLKRKEQVEVRAIPMRVARQETAEESDAKARAIAELVQIGGFSSEAVQEDFRGLFIPLAENVPFYETLSVFTATDPKLDFLTLNYLRLASQLLREDVGIPNLDTEFIERVRRRLQPRRATVEYIKKLTSAESTRATDELARLVESAFDDQLDGKTIDDEYVGALVDTAFALLEDSEDEIAVLAVQGRVLDLLRQRANSNTISGKLALANALEKYLELNYVLEPEEELGILEELDALFATWTVYSVRLKRLDYRRRAARIYIGLQNHEAALQAIGEIQTLLKDLAAEQPKLALDQEQILTHARLDLFLLRGDIYKQKAQLDDARKQFEEGLKSLESLATPRAEVDTFTYAFHSRLGDGSIPGIPPDTAANHAIKAISGSLRNPAVMRRFPQFAKVVLSSDRKSELVGLFCETAIGNKILGGGSFLNNYFGRQPTLTIELVSTVLQLSEGLGDDQKLNDSLLSDLAMTVDGVYRSALRRKQTFGPRVREELTAQAVRFVQLLRDRRQSVENYPSLIEATKLSKLRVPDRKDIPNV